MWISVQLFLVGGVASNYLDEIKGRPWHTKISEKNLWFIGFSALIASSIVGIHLTLSYAPFFWIFIIVWGFFAITYDLELFNGLFHNTSSLAVCWGSVCLGSYYLQSLKITPQILIVSYVAGCIAGFGRNTYEVSKTSFKDKNPSSSKLSQSASRLLWIQIFIIDILSISLLIYKFLL